MPTVTSSYPAPQPTRSGSSQAAPSATLWPATPLPRTTISSFPSSSLQSPFKLAPNASDSKTRAKRSRRPSLTRRQKRVHPNEDCPIMLSETAPFDELPWISVLRTEPEPQQPYFDISELGSLFDDEEMYHGPGPVRRRKTSLHSHQTSTMPSSPPPTRSLEPRLLSATFQERLAASRPKTPIRDTSSLSSVRFCNLMPDFGKHTPYSPLSSPAMF